MVEPVQHSDVDLFEGVEVALQNEVDLVLHSGQPENLTLVHVARVWSSSPKKLLFWKTFRGVFRLPLYELQFETTKSVRKSWSVYLRLGAVQAEYRLELEQLDVGQVLHEEVNFEAKVLEQVLLGADLVLGLSLLPAQTASRARG